MASDSIKNRVRACLAQAEDPACTKAEAEAFFQKAQELMQAYAITESDIEASKPSTERSKATMIKTSIKANYLSARVALFNRIAQCNRCDLVYSKEEYMNATIYLYGLPGDIDYVMHLFNSLTVQLDRELDKIEVPKGSNGKAYRQSFIHGFRTAIGQRLEKANETALLEAHQKCQAAVKNFQLMTVERKEEIEKLIEETVGETKEHSSAASDDGALHEGYQKGKKASISRGALPGPEGVADPITNEADEEFEEDLEEEYE
jgi:hypothetical protein